jgi:predicted TPR repeat methyltransferase
MNRKQRRMEKRLGKPVIQEASPGMQKVLANALRHHQAGRLNEAERFYRQILAVNPRFAEGYNNLGSALNGQGKPDEAVACYRRALDLRPDFAEAHYNLGNALNSQGNLDEAVTCYRRVLDLKPNYAEAHNNLGNALNGQGKPDEAVACYRRALEIKPDFAETHCNLGNALKDQGKLDEAVVRYQRALALKPHYAQAHNNLGNVLNDQGESDEAVVQYQRALALKPNYAEAHNGLGNALNNQGNLDEAITCYRRALDLKPNYAEAHNNLGAALNGQGKLDDAVACYRRALDVKPDFAEAHYSLGNTLKDQGKLDEALVHYRRALALKANYAEAYLDMGTALKELGRLTDAEASYRRALEFDPGDTLGARLLLASLSPERVPARASEAHLNKLYVKRSHHWDLGQTSYFGHQLVAEALKKLRFGSKKLDILDAGCGTGLVGVLIRDLANRLDGIDISSAMLEKARQKNIYDHIHLGDLLSFMVDNSNAYDVITCAATLIHFGDLTPVFHAAAFCLRNEGLFVFTLFSNDSGHNDQEVVVHQNSFLATGGCFAHSSSYVSRLAGVAGFSVEILEHRIHEYHRKTTPTMGLVVALRRRSRLTP